MRYFASAAIINTDQSFTYKGFGYTYILHTGGPQGTYAKLRLKADTMRQFVERVGACNSIKIPGLQVFQTGGGWWTITVLNENLRHLVVKFLARFNKWVFHRIEQQQAKDRASVLVNNSLHTIYQVQHHGWSRKPASTDQLHALASNVNSRYGHHHRVH